MNFLTGVATGFILTVLANQIKQEFIIYRQNKIIKDLVNDRRNIKGENYSLKTQQQQKQLDDNDHEERILSLELRISQAEQWFGSMIRHSVEAPWPKDAIEKFLAEQEELKKG